MNNSRNNKCQTVDSFYLFTASPRPSPLSSSLLLPRAGVDSGSDSDDDTAEGGVQLSLPVLVPAYKIFLHA